MKRKIDVTKLCKLAFDPSTKRASSKFFFTKLLICYLFYQKITIGKIFYFKKKIWRVNLLHCILWKFQNFITVSKFFLKNWNFAHLLVSPKTTTTPKIRRFYWKPEEIFHFLCFLSFGCRSPKNGRKISNKKWILCKCVLLIYIWKNFFCV